FDAAFDNQGNLWVADYSNDRILEFQQPFSSGMSAELTMQGCPTPSPACFYDPQGLAFDAAGDLWVSDAANSRVLEFTPPFSNGMAATLAIGAQDLYNQENYCGGYDPSIPDPARHSVCSPYGLAFDGAGRLWVADQSYSRVVGFSPPFSNGMGATYVLGQAD